MIFNDINSLNEIISITRITSQFRDDNDPEVDRFLNSSPQINEESLQISYEYETMKTFPLSSPRNQKDTTSVTKSNEEGKNSQSTVLSSSKAFVPSKVPTKMELANQKSALTLILNSNQNTASKAASVKADTGNVKLTIYLPDCTPINIMVNDSDTFDAIIKKTIVEHKATKRTPPLPKDQSEFYELRMHEGDGEPDEDFPPLERNKTLKQFNEKEFCLCQIKGSINTPISPVGTGILSVSPSTRGVIAAPEPDNLVTIIIPNVIQVKAMFNEDTVLRDLLPFVAEDLNRKGHKLRLHTDEFVFVIPEPIQAKLKLLSPFVSLETPVSTLPTKTFELQKRMFADSIRTVRIATQKNVQKLDGGELQYTDTLANVYQEWNIVKKNKFGRKQERIIGIDGKNVYNAKRGDKRGIGPGSNVARAQRELSSIRKVEVIDSDKKAFRITWEEDGKGELLHDIEYYCESAKDCAEIIAKLTFLIYKKR